MHSLFHAQIGWCSLPASSPVIAIGAHPSRTIFECAEAGDVHGVEWWILEGGASAGDVDALGWTPLLYAVKFGRSGVCRVLLALAPSASLLADTPEKGGVGWVPLQWAAQMGHFECVQLLLEKEAAPNGPRSGKSSKSPLRLATYSGFPMIAELLLGFGADPRGQCSEEFAVECLQRYSWYRRRKIFLIRDKACITEGPESKLQQLLAQRPLLFRMIARFL